MEKGFFVYAWDLAEEGPKATNLPALAEIIRVDVHWLDAEATAPGIVHEHIDMAQIGLCLREARVY